MTIIRTPNGCTIVCDAAGCEKKLVGLHSNTTNAQRAAKNFFGWRTYNEDGLWKHACINHVAEYANRKKEK